MQLVIAIALGGRLFPMGFCILIFRHWLLSVVMRSSMVGLRNCIALDSGMGVGGLYDKKLGQVYVQHCLLGSVDYTFSRTEITVRKYHTCIAHHICHP